MKLAPVKICRADLYERIDLAPEVLELLADRGLVGTGAIDEALLDGRLAELVQQPGTGVGRGTWRQVVYARTKVPMRAPRPNGRPPLRGRTVWPRLSEADATWLTRESLEIGCTKAELARRALALLDSVVRTTAGPAPLLGRLAAAVVEQRSSRRSMATAIRLPVWLDHRASALAAAIGACTTPELARLAISEARADLRHRSVLRSSPERSEALVLSAQLRSLGRAS